MKKIILSYFPIFYLLSNPFKIYEFYIVNKYIKEDNHAIILDLGCGNGMQAIMNRKKFDKIIGIDTDENSILYGQKNISFLNNSKIRLFNKSINDINFQSKYFDGVISYCTLEHILNYEQVLKETYRVLKHGGWILFTVDSLANIKDSYLLNKHRADHNVFKYFNKKEIEEALCRKNFVNVMIQPVFKSNFAKRLFELGIKKQFKFNKIPGFLYTVLLFLSEYIYRGEDKGIILVIKAYKA